MKYESNRKKWEWGKKGNIHRDLTMLSLLKKSYSIGIAISDGTTHSQEKKIRSLSTLSLFELSLISIMLAASYVRQRYQHASKDRCYVASCMHV